MKAIIYPIIYFLFSSSSFAQQQLNYDTSKYHYSLSGTVIDEDLKLPIPNADIRLVGSDNTSLTLKTDENGKYIFPKDVIKPNTIYIISASGLEVNTKEFPDGLLGNPKYKLSTKDTVDNVAFIFNPTLKKMSKADYSPMVIFEKNEAELYDGAQEEIELMGKILTESPNITVEIRGHSGVSETNAQKLALKRAKLVKKKLMKMGIPSDRLSVAGKVQADSVFLKGNEGYDHFKSVFPVEQFRTRVYFVIIRKDYSISRSPAIKLDMEDTLKTLIGDFFNVAAYEWHSLTLKADSTFEQEGGGCVWHLKAKGKWKMSLDTIILTPNKIYSINEKRKKRLITDTNSSDYKQFYIFNKILVVNNYSLMQLCKYSNSPIKQIGRLRRRTK